MEIPIALKKQYVSRREKELEECAMALEQKNSAIFKRVGHQLKGNALTYGFPELGQLGAQLEEAAKSENWDLITQYAAQYKDMVAALPKFPSE